MRPHLKKMGVISPEQHGEFVAAREDVLEVDQKPYDPQVSVVCLDEQPVQVIAEIRKPIPAEAGKPEREDDEYERKGTANMR